ncbi:hypothetical protein THAOC_08079, partial [Thalassiosira oceanica]
IVPRRTVSRRGGTILARLDLLGAGGPRGETRRSRQRRPNDDETARARPLATEAARRGAAPRNTGPRRGRRRGRTHRSPPLVFLLLSRGERGGGQTAWAGGPFRLTRGREMATAARGERYNARRMSLARSAGLPAPESTATARVEERRVPVKAAMMPLSSLHAFERPDDEEARNQLHRT